MSSEERKKWYIKTYSKIAVEQMKKYKIPASIILAQGLVESGAGASNLALKSNNHFGIKCHQEWRGRKVYHDDDKKNECFRKYKNPIESYKDHSEFLTTRGRYSFLFRLPIKDYVGWSEGLSKAGYATDPKYPEKLINVNVIASSEGSNFSNFPQYEEWKFSNDSAYVHFCPNETMQGIAMHEAPNFKKHIVADMTSAILSEPLDVKDYSLIYAGAQKNIGPAGLTVVIISKDFMNLANKDLPKILQYAEHSKADSMLNTPPTFSWYVAGNCLLYTSPSPRDATLSRMPSSA